MGGWGGGGGERGGRVEKGVLVRHGGGGVSNARKDVN